MAFVQQTSRSFTRQDIESLSQNQCGVYGIFRAGQWIYVGKGDIRTRMLAHLNGDKPAILNQLPTHWVAELCTDPNMSVRERALILECNPLCNERVG